MYCLVFRNSRSREAPESQITKSSKSLPKATVRGGRVGSRGLAGCGALLQEAMGSGSELPEVPFRFLFFPDITEMHTIRAARELPAHSSLGKVNILNG